MTGRAKQIIESHTVKVNEAADINKIIKELIDTSWSGDNNSQMKAVQLLKGIATSDEPAANAFMKKLDTFTSGMKVGDKKKVAEGKDDFEIKVKVSADTISSINRDKKKEYKAAIDKLVKDIKDGVNLTSI